MSGSLLVRMALFFEKEYMLENAPRIGVADIFNDAMVLFVQEKDNDNLSRGARALFKWAAKHSHPEAGWISEILEKCGGDLKTIFFFFEKSDIEKAQYFVWLKTGNPIQLLCAASTGWNVPYGVMLLHQRPFSENVCREWILKHGDRNTCWDAHGVARRNAYYTYHSNNTMVFCPGQVSVGYLASMALSSVSWRFTFRSMRLNSNAPTDFAKRIVNDPHLLVAFSKFHNATLYSFGEAIRYVGHGLEYACSELDNQLREQYPHSGLNACTIVHKALTFHQQVDARKRKAIDATMQVCKIYGCNRDICNMIAALIVDTVSIDHWIENFEEWTLTSTGKKQKYN